MISRYSYHEMTWVDVESPTKEEIVHIMEEFSLPSRVAEDVVSNTLHSKVDLYDDLIYMILHFPPSSKNDDVSTDQELDFIISKDFIITIHYEEIYQIEQFKKNFESLCLRDHHKSVQHGGMVFMEMIKDFYRHTLHRIESTSEAIETIEFHIFKGEEEQMVKRISLTNRKLLDFKRALHFHEDILKSYESASKKIFGEEYGYYSRSILSEFNKVHSLLQSNRETILDLQTTNDSLLSTKTNDIMRTFTILTFVMIPLTIITGIFGMNTTSDLIFIQSKSDFFFVVGVMLIIGLVMFLFFKVRKWL